MISTNRLQYTYVDTSYVTPQESAVVGFTVVKAPKGLIKAQLINATDTKSVLELFGTPNSTYPDIQNVLDYVSNYSCWVSAPGGASATIGSSFGGAYQPAPA